MSSSSQDPTQTFVCSFYESLGTPRALTAYLLYKYKEYTQLVSLEFDPFHYNDLDQARCALAATSFLSKARFLDLPYDKSEVAKKKFFEAERQCLITNHNLRRGYFKTIATGCILSRMQSKISQILGPVIDVEELVDSCGWGPGATTSLRRRQANHPKKFSAERQITAEAYYFIKDWFYPAYPIWADFTMEITSGNKVVTVPKNSKTDRVIAIEPGLNGWFQKGCGKMIRRRLNRFGIDLNDQSHNQIRAKIASRFDSLATVDFASASDTISYELVEQLLPRNWFLLLRSFRSSVGLIDGQFVKYEKFSSMGNGYTFELESLIFYALALACCDYLGVDSESVSVFGDDVIIPKSVYDLFVSVSRDIGFTVNSSKSFSSSYFRESCGAFYWNGADIKPIFLKEALHDVPNLLLAVNNVRRLAHRFAGRLACDSRFYRCWRSSADLLGKDFPSISEGFGELGIIENFDNLRNTVKPAYPLEGWYVKVWAVSFSQAEERGRGLLITRLRDIGSSDVAWGNFIPTDRVKMCRRRILIPRWYDLGPWA